MPQSARFWRNVTLIGLTHVALIVGFVRWSREPKNSNAQSIVWMNGGDGAGVEAKAVAAPKPVKTASPRTEAKTEPPKKEEPEDERPFLASAKSEIQLPAPKSSPTSTPTVSPARTPKPAATPRVKATPKPTPKPSPKPTPTASPARTPSPKKMTLAKASPKPKPTREEAKDKEEQKEDVDLEKKKIAKGVLAKNDADESASATKKTVVAQTGAGKGTSAGVGGRVGGAGGESQFGWYGSMLHDRFYSEWVQPTSIASGAKNSVLVKIRIEKDGRVSGFEVIKPSGNTAVDESVAAVAKRVTEVDPLPAGLGNGEHYDVKINFELNSE